MIKHIINTIFVRKFISYAIPMKTLRKSYETAAIYKNALKVVKIIETNQSSVLRMSPKDQKVWRKYGAHRVVLAMTQNGMKCILMD